MAAPLTGDDIARGTRLMVFAALLLASGATSARFATEGMNVFVVVFWTNMTMFIMMSGYMLIARPEGGVHTDKLPLHFLRSVFTYGALVAYFYALAQIPFATAVILQSTGPVFVPILAILVFRRLSDRYVWLGVAISFVGVVLLVRPDRIGISLGEFSALLAALGGAAAALVIWSFSSTEPVARQMFYFSFFACLLSALPLPWTWHSPTLAHLTPIIAVAGFTIVGQFYYAKAFSAAPGDKVITWSYMAIVFAADFGFVFWGEPIVVLSALGAGLVVGGAHLATRAC
ncbi:DMT family transporter [Aestuariibius sp. 2305UL40-4]|uniref:DMT family transporter n=1 Tax=Aestuariibius violaceus TaxID=3234132 RepID=UPI00345E37A6